MNSMRIESIVLHVGETAMIICYTLSRRADGCYSIYLDNRTTGEQAAAFDITRNPMVAEELYQSLIRGRVTAVTFHDVVEDFVAEI